MHYNGLGTTLNDHNDTEDHKSDQKLKKKNGMNKTNIYISVSCNSARLEHDFTKHHRG